MNKLSNSCQATEAGRHVSFTQQQASSLIKPYLANDRSKILRNWAREVWYMTLTMLISVMRKYRMLPRDATGRYLAWAILILISASAATLSLALTSAAVCLVVLRMPIMESSSTRDPSIKQLEYYFLKYNHRHMYSFPGTVCFVFLPFVLLSLYSRLSSSSCIFLLLAVTSSISFNLSASSSC